MLSPLRTASAKYVLCLDRCRDLWFTAYRDSRKSLKEVLTGEESVINHGASGPLKPDWILIGLQNQKPGIKIFIRLDDGRKFMELGGSFIYPLSVVFLTFTYCTSTSRTSKSDPNSRMQSDRTVLTVGQQLMEALPIVY